jgi:hypothetical protein
MLLLKQVASPALVPSIRRQSGTTVVRRCWNGIDGERIGRWHPLHAHAKLWLSSAEGWQRKRATRASGPRINAPPCNGRTWPRSSRSRLPRDEGSSAIPRAGRGELGIVWLYVSSSTKSSCNAVSAERSERRAPPRDHSPRLARG